MGGYFAARHRVGLVAALVSLVTTSPWLVRAAESDSSGDARQACIISHEAAQELRLDAKLLESRKELRRCADEGCPAAVRVDCLNWLNEVEAAIPNIVVVAQSDRGDEINIAVKIDGIFVADHLDGKAIDLDPGTHVLNFLPADGSPVEMRLVIGQGEKNRILRLDFRSPVVSAPNVNVAATGLPAPFPPSPLAPTARPVPVATYVLGATALVAVASATYFGLKARSARNSAANECAPICSESVVDDVNHKALYSDVSTGVAVAAAGAAALIYLTRPAVTYLPASGAMRSWLDHVQLGLSPASGYASVRGFFE